MRCYEEEVDYDIESLGKEEWLTGCALCGGTCWDKSKKDIDRIDAELDKESEEST